MRKLITLLLTLLLALSLCACDAGKANKDDTFCLADFITKTIG